jgi:hypothetical protein
MAKLSYDPMSAMGIRIGFPDGNAYLVAEKPNLIVMHGEAAYADMEAAVFSNDVAAAYRLAAAITPDTTYEPRRMGMWTEVHYGGATKGHSKLRTRHEAVAIVSAVCSVRLNDLSRARKAGSVGSMEILLANVGNPDMRQDPDRPLPGTDSGYWKTVDSWEDASRAVREYVIDSDFGSENWSGGEVRDSGTREVLGRVSYNGHILPKEPADPENHDQGAAPRR